jgi:putative protease
MELLAPAGDLEKLRFALDYGADAVYFGGEVGSLRAGAGNLSAADVHEGVSYAHALGKKAYMAANIYAHEDDFGPLRGFLAEVGGAGIDGYIVSDPGVLALVRETVPDAAIHLSTQASATNAAAAAFWRDAGVSRIIAARELSLPEIGRMAEAVPEVEIEAFAHGAMCVSYSGRCLLSAVMTGRDANRGACAHPCRYGYALVEEKRPGEYFPVEQDVRGTYILNSKDLCMIGHIGRMAAAGIRSLKIEGRMKSLYYVAVVVKAYRQAIDAFYAARPEDAVLRPAPSGATGASEGAGAGMGAGGRGLEAWMRELRSVSHRHFTTGFYLGRPEGEGQSQERGGYSRTHDFVGVVKEYRPESGTALVEQRNKFSRGERVEIFGPEGEGFEQTLGRMWDEEGAPVESAPHPRQRVVVEVAEPVGRGYLLRRGV